MSVPLIPEILLSPSNTSYFSRASASRTWSVSNSIPFWTCVTIPFMLALVFTYIILSVSVSVSSSPVATHLCPKPRFSYSCTIAKDFLYEKKIKT